MVALTMTSTTALPTHRLSSSGPSSSGSPDKLSVAEIKELARQDVQRTKNTSSPAAMLHVAREMIANIDNMEAEGDLKSTLRLYYVASK